MAASRGPAAFAGVLCAGGVRWSLYNSAALNSYCRLSLQSMLFLWLLGFSMSDALVLLLSSLMLLILLSAYAGSQVVLSLLPTGGHLLAPTSS